MKTLHLPGLLFLPSREHETGPRDEPKRHDQNHDNNQIRFLLIMHISTNNADDYCEICFRVLEITKNRKNNDD